MFCTKCGTQCRDGAQFCTSCGAKLIAPGAQQTQGQSAQNEQQAKRMTTRSRGQQGQVPPGYAAQPQQKNASGSRAGLIALCAVLVLAVFVLGGILVRRLVTSDRGSGTLSGLAASTVSPEEEPDSVPDPLSDEASQEDEGDEGAAPLSPDATGNSSVAPPSDDRFLAEFSIAPDTETDYSNALDPSTYLRYSGGVSDFSFSYPPQLYHTVTVDRESHYNTLQGRNIEEITFKGTEGSVLRFFIMARMDADDLSNMMDFIHDEQTSSLNEATDILFRTSGDHGKSIVTGWYKEEAGFAVYDMCKIEPDYILQMYVRFPGYESETDRLQKAYVTENLYRMCGFSDSTQAVRSYETFLRESGQ